jgi:hypothetical protein
MIKRICSAQDDGIRPLRGAARGLETNGRRFRPQQNRRTNRHGVQRNGHDQGKWPSPSLSATADLRRSVEIALATDIVSRRLGLGQSVTLKPGWTMGVSKTAKDPAIIIWCASHPDVVQDALPSLAVPGSIVPERCDLFGIEFWQWLPLDLARPTSRAVSLGDHPLELCDTRIKTGLSLEVMELAPECRTCLGRGSDPRLLLELAYRSHGVTPQEG